MRGIFGFLSLLVVLAVVGLIAKAQLRGAASVASHSQTAAAASAAGLTGTDRTFGIAPEMGAGMDPTLSDGQQIREVQKRAADGAAKAMQRGTERNEAADSSGR